MSSKVSCPGSSTMTSDGKACEVKLDIPLFCGLTADSAPGWPRCYGGDGAPLQPPPAPNADGGSSTGTGKSKLQPKCSDILNVQYDNLLDSINNIHAFEGKLFSDLEAVENGQESSMSAMEIKGRIGDLSQLRNQLYKDLNNILTSTQCNLADSRMNLADQIAMVDIVKKELDNAEKAINELQIIRNNRKRMVQITNYEKQRYSSHTDIFRTIAFCGLGVLAGVYLINAGMRNTGNAVILLAIAIGVILTARAIYYNYWRSGMNWNRFDWGSYSGPRSGDTVYQHDVRAFEKLYDDTSAEVSDIETKAEQKANQIYDAGKKVYGQAGSAVGAVAGSAMSALNSTTKKKTWVGKTEKKAGAGSGQNLGCNDACHESSQCSTGMFCCPNHHVCMDSSTGGTWGPACNK